MGNCFYTNKPRSTIKIPNRIKISIINKKKKQEQKAYSKPKLEYSFLRSSLVSSVPILQNTNQMNRTKLLEVERSLALTIENHQGKLL